MKHASMSTKYDLAPDASPRVHLGLPTGLSAAGLRRKIFRECVRKSRDKNEAEWESKRA